MHQLWAAWGTLVGHSGFHCFHFYWDRSRLPGQLKARQNQPGRRDILLRRLLCYDLKRLSEPPSPTQPGLVPPRQGHSLFNPVLCGDGLESAALFLTHLTKQALVLHRHSALREPRVHGGRELPGQSPYVQWPLQPRPSQLRSSPRTRWFVIP